MSAAVYEIEVGGVGAGAAAPALRTALEGSKDAFHIAAVHWVAVAFAIRPAAHGRVEVSPVLCMWLVLRISPTYGEWRALRSRLFQIAESSRPT